MCAVFDAVGDVSGLSSDAMYFDPFFYFKDDVDSTAEYGYAIGSNKIHGFWLGKSKSHRGKLGCRSCFDGTT